MRIRPLVPGAQAGSAWWCRSPRVLIANCTSTARLSIGDSPTSSRRQAGTGPLEQHELDAVLGAVLGPEASDEEVPADLRTQVDAVVVGQVNAHVVGIGV